MEWSTKEWAKTGFASAGNRTRIGCLEVNHSDHWRLLLVEETHISNNVTYLPNSKKVFALGEARTRDLRMSQHIPSTAYKYDALSNYATRAPVELTILFMSFHIGNVSA